MIPLELRQSSRIIHTLYMLVSILLYIHGNNFCLLTVVAGCTVLITIIFYLLLSFWFAILKIYLFTYLFLAMLVFVPMWTFSLVAASGVYALVAVHGLLLVVSSLVVEHRFRGMQLEVVAHGLHSYSSRALGHRLGSCGARAQLLHGLWDPGLGSNLCLLHWRVFITEPPGKPALSFFDQFLFCFPFFHCFFILVKGLANGSMTSLFPNLSG